MKATFDSKQVVTVSGDPNIYEIGVFDSNNARRLVLSASAGMGTLDASSLATNALRSFPQLQHIIMVGIAGGCPNHSKPDEHVRLGDVALSGPGGIIAHDFVKETVEGRHIRSSPQKPSAVLLKVAAHLQAEELLGNRPWEPIAALSLQIHGDAYRRPPDSCDVLNDNGQTVPHPPDSQRREGAPRIFSGVIAAADTLLRSAATRDLLRDQFGARAVEMEASGVQNAAWHQGKDIFVVRGICDYCDSAKNDDWQNYAALVAASYARAMIEAMPAEWI